MHGKTPEVLQILAAPDRETSLKAISLCLLRIHGNHGDNGLTWVQIAKALDCSVETVFSARDEGNLLSFDKIARLGYFFPDEFKVVRQLWENGREPETADGIRDEIHALTEKLRARCGE